MSASITAPSAALASVISSLTSAPLRTLKKENLKPLSLLLLGSHFKKAGEGKEGKKMQNQRDKVYIVSLSPRRTDSGRRI